MKTEAVTQERFRVLSKQRLLSKLRGENNAMQTWLSPFSS